MIKCTAGEDIGEQVKTHYDLDSHSKKYAPKLTIKLTSRAKRKHINVDIVNLEVPSKNVIYLFTIGYILM